MGQRFLYAPLHRCQAHGFQDRSVVQTGVAPPCVHLICQHRRAFTANAEAAGQSEMLKTLRWGIPHAQRF